MDSVLSIKLKNNPLVYRDKLTIPRNINFGLEMELDQVNYSEICDLISKHFGKDWRVCTDDSLTAGKNAEIVSPVLYNSKKTWILLRKMGELLEKVNASYDKCSFQINFDGKLLPTGADKVRFLKLYAMYEDIIYRFSKGEDSEYRSTLDLYAHPIILSIKDMDLSMIVDFFSDNKRYGVIFKSEKDLIEFRTPNMTSNPVLWQNYVTTFYYLLDFATSDKCDIKVLDEYIDKFYKSYVLEDYEREKEDKAIQFSKKIFYKGVDRINFMHQYSGK